MTFRAPKPRGATAAFAEAVAAKYGAPFAHSWLSAKTCRFTDTTIFTTALGCERLRQYCEVEIAMHDVTIVFCADVTRDLYREVDAAKRGGL